MSYQLKLAAEAYAYRAMRDKFLTEDFVPTNNDGDDVAFAYEPGEEAEVYYDEMYNKYLEEHGNGS